MAANAPRGEAVLFGLLLAGVAAGCGGTEDRAGEIPITTRSAHARNLYLEGRDLAEKLRFTDSRRYFLDALAEDESFALAHLALANSSPTTQEFYASLDRAVASIDAESEGEREMILAAAAGARSDRATQLEHLLRLVESYSGDERAHALLGHYHLGRQHYADAIARYERAVEIDPLFSAPFNGMGYALMGLGRHDDAETAFLKYIELIPDEPNPYDSYADLLMKMGRFEESIETYEKALSHNPNFIASHLGIGNNQIFLGRPERARESFRKLLEIARNDAERRRALRWMAASCIHEDDHEQALEQVRRMMAIAEEGGDKPAASGDLVLMGDILLHAGAAEDALVHYRAAVEMMDAADVPEEVRQDTRRNYLYSRARVALAVGDLETARTATASFGEQVASHSDPAAERRHHELLGRIALIDGDFEEALAELQRADSQDPAVLILVAEALERLGDAARSGEAYRSVAEFNTLGFSYAFVRARARQKVEEASR